MHIMVSFMLFYHDKLIEHIGGRISSGQICCLCFSIMMASISYWGGFCLWICTIFSFYIFPAPSWLQRKWNFSCLQPTQLEEDPSKWTSWCPSVLQRERQQQTRCLNLQVLNFLPPVMIYSATSISHVQNVSFLLEWASCLSWEKKMLHHQYHTHLNTWICLDFVLGF